MLLLFQRIFSKVPVPDIDTIIFNCGPLIMDASLVLEDFFQDFDYNQRFSDGPA